MKTFVLTKIVPVCLLMALSACTNKEVNRANRARSSGEGTQSAFGKTLATGTWCKASTVTAAGVVQVEKMVFSSNGSVLKTNYVLLSDGTLKPQAEGEGTWAIIDTSLVLMQPGQKTVSLRMAHATREADNAKCLDLGQDDEAGTIEQICRCN